MPAVKKTPGRNNFKYRPQFGVIVVCKDEAEQQAVYAALKQQHQQVKVVSV